MVEEVTAGEGAERMGTGAGAGAATRRELLLLKNDALGVEVRGVDVRGVEIRAAVRAAEVGMERIAYDSFMWWAPALPRA